MDKDIEDQLQKAMGYITVTISCEECNYHREENEKTHYSFVCTYNTIGDIEVYQLGRCNKFERK